MAICCRPAPGQRSERGRHSGISAQISASRFLRAHRASEGERKTPPLRRNKPGQPKSSPGFLFVICPPPVLGWREEAPRRCSLTTWKMWTGPLRWRDVEMLCPLRRSLRRPGRYAGLAERLGGCLPSNPDGFDSRSPLHPSARTTCAQTHGHGGVAQLGERLPCKQEVVGSKPITSTRLRIQISSGREADS